MKKCLLPHYNERQSDVDVLVLHATAHHGFDAVDCLNELKLSAHYVLTLEGELIKLVDEKNRAWHAGVAYWRGIETDLNSHSIGIEVCSLSLGQEAFSQKQIQKLVDVCRRIIKRHHILPENVVGHSDIAPLRKPDPGLAFPWEYLAKRGVGLWFDLAFREKSRDISYLLSKIGYDTRSKEAVEASAYAFCRHFLPKYVAKDDNPAHLVDNFLPDNYDFMAQKDFLETLQAVAYVYK